MQNFHVPLYKKFLIRRTLGHRYSKQIANGVLRNDFSTCNNEQDCFTTLGIRSIFTLVGSTRRQIRLYKFRAFAYSDATKKMKLRAKVDVRESSRIAYFSPVTIVISGFTQLPTRSVLRDVCYKEHFCIVGN